MGLIHPFDLDAFRRDEASRQSLGRLRRIAHLARPTVNQVDFHVVASSRDADILVAMDSQNISCQAAVGDPLEFLPGERVAVITPFPPLARDDKQKVDCVRDLDELQRAFPKVSTVVSAGHHVPAGALVHRYARRVGAVCVVVQHGMLLPQAAPLPPEVHVAAWSEADAQFWTTGRNDCVTHVVGSQLLHRAMLSPHRAVALDDQPIYVGALHGTELPRRQIEQIARQFCLATGAKYRPHPSEVDLQSRATHAIWKKLGISFADPSIPLLELGAPVVGMWSTGVLEAASAGRPAWVYHPDPPDWLREVWDRYGLAQWGAEPTVTREISTVSPAQRFAELVVELSR